MPDGIVPDMPTIPVPPIGPIPEPTPMPFAPPVLENPDPGPFTGGATDAIRRTRYFPAEVRGRHVAQLVDQSFVFRITR
jgi:hypothetical protein